MNLLLRWLISAAAVGAAAAAHFVPGITVTGGLKTYFVVALMLGLVNAIVRPIVKAFACGIIFITLGLFLLVINAAMLWLTSVLAQHFGYGFYVQGFEPALLGSLVISVVSWIGSMLLKDDEKE
jgi:putative membrane protein